MSDAAAEQAEHPPDQHQTLSDWQHHEAQQLPEQHQHQEQPVETVTGQPSGGSRPETPVSGIFKVGHAAVADRNHLVARTQRNETFDFGHHVAIPHQEPVQASASLAQWDPSGHAGVSSAFDTALNAMTEHSQLLADFAMSAHEGSARVGYYDPSDPMHQAFHHQHESSTAAADAERDARGMIEAMERSSQLPPPVNQDGDMDISMEVGSSHRATKPRAPRAPRNSAGRGTKTSRKSKNADGSAGPSTPMLTPEQKKINHIVSEQRRRASIRRGYELLCEEVPALRLAPLMNGATRGGSGPGGGGAVGGRKRDRDVLLGLKGPVGDKRKRPRMSSHGLASTSHLGEPQDDTSIAGASPSAIPATEVTRNADSELAAAADPSAMEAILLAQHQEQADLDGSRRPSQSLPSTDHGAAASDAMPIVSADMIGSDGRSGPRSETNVLQKTIEYLRSLHSVRLANLDRLAQLREIARSRFPPERHEELRLHPQVVENVVVIEPKLPTLQEFIKQYNAKVAAGQFLKGKGVKERKLQVSSRSRRGKAQETEDSLKSTTSTAEPSEQNNGIPHPIAEDDGLGTTPTHVTTSIAEGPPTEEPTSTVVEDIKRPEPVFQKVLVDWEDVWKGGQIIDDEEEADAQANA